MSDGDPVLSHCGCCASESPLSPIDNRPGLPALSYRIGVYGVFFRRLLDAIHTAADPSGAASLAALTTRATDDPTISLLDAWAIVADVLTFYQERIANEGYLRTATERRSVLELARSIGYELAPGVASTVQLAFTVEEVIGMATAPGAPGNPALASPGPGNSPYNRGIVAIPKGTQLQSVPAPKTLPQSFETSADFEARVEWNAMRPRLSRHADLAIANGHLYLLGVEATFSTYTLLNVADVYLLNSATRLDPAASTVRAKRIDVLYFKGTSTNLSRGDRMLLVGTNGPTEVTQVFVVERIDIDPDRNQTRIAFVNNPGKLPAFQPVAPPPVTLTDLTISLNSDTVATYITQATISEDDLQALGKFNSWDLQQVSFVAHYASLAVLLETGVYAFRATAGIFGHNAPRWSSLPKPDSLRGDPYPFSWDDPNWGLGRLIWTDSQGYERSHADLCLERTFPLVRINTWAYFECPFTTAVYRITEVAEQSIADYGLSGKTTSLTLKLKENERPLSLGSPSVVTWGPNRLDVFAIDGHGTLQHHWMTGTTWHGPEQLPGDAYLINAPSAVTRGTNSLDVFAISWDGHLYYWHWNGVKWKDPIKFTSGFLINSPSAVSREPGRLDAFAVGWDGNLYQFWVEGGQHDGPELRGGGFLVNSPSAVSRIPGTIDVLVNTTVGYMWQFFFVGNAWGPAPLLSWEQVVNNLTWNNSPAAVSSAPDRVDLFAIDSHGALYHTFVIGALWQLDFAEKVGGKFLVDSPAAVSRLPGEVDVIARASNGHLFHSRSEPGGWSPLQDLGGNVTGTPSVVSWGPKRLDILASDANGHLFHTWFNGSWHGPDDLGGPNPPFFPVRSTTAWVQSEQLPLDAIPVEDDIPAGSTTLMLNNLVPGLSAGRAVALNGARADASGLTGDEVLVLKDVVHNGGYTVLEFKTPLQYSYTRYSLTVNANVTEATHGATVQEVLGSGDASQPNQAFALKRPPLTYTLATTPSGAASSLEVRVNDLAWTETPTLYGHGPRDENYTVSLADDGTPTLTFGEPASRLRTGQNNVRATYRSGIGLDGNVDAGSISILMSRPPGLRGVSNPAPATGGANPEHLDSARTNAPLRVLTLDRIVSLDDYEDFCRAFAGIGKAQAVEIWSGQTRLVHVTLAAANGDSIDSTWPLYTALTAAIRNSHDPVQQFRLAGYQPLTFKLSAGILVDRPRYEADIVMANVAAALANTFSFASRAFAQAVTAAEIVALIQGIEGVRAATLSQLYLATDPAGPQQLEPPPFLAASPAHRKGGIIKPAELLLLNPYGARLTELTA